jgi:hypothetical protein
MGTPLDFFRLPGELCPAGGAVIRWKKGSVGERGDVVWAAGREGRLGEEGQEAKASDIQSPS